MVQPKLAVNSPGDRFEQEADEVAETVVGMQDVADGAIQPGLTPVIQRKCAHCEEEEENALQRKPEGASGGHAVGPQFSHTLQASKGEGRPLPTDARMFMESRFGTDFGQVTIHHDAKAARLSRGLNAQAFTHGHHIYFNEGKFAPHTQAGKRLLAHELTHVIQQTGGTGPAPRMIQRQEEPGVMERASVAMLDTVLPVGNGFYFELNGGITWGYPIYTGGSALIYVSRASQSQLHILVRKQGRLAFDTGVGGSIMFGRQRSQGAGGRDGLGIGAEAGANFMAGVLGTVVEEYSIPVGDFLNFVGSKAIETAIDTALATTPVTSLLSGPVQDLLGTSADEYMTRQQIEGGIFANADAEVGAGLRRPTNSFNDAGEGPGGQTQMRARTWGPGDDRDLQGTTNELDSLSFLNHFLSVFLSANASAQLVGGYEQQTAGNTATHAVYLEGQVGAMLGIPIPVVGDFLSSLPPDAGGGIRLELIETPGEPTEIRAVVYLKQGEDQYYAGTAGQQNMVFNLTNIVSVEELANAFRTGQMPAVGPLTFNDFLEKVSFFSRLSLGMQSRLLGRFLTRQTGTRSLLSDSTLSKARRMWGVELEVYLDYAGEMDGADFMSVAQRLLSAGGQAISSVSGAEDFSSAYEQLSRFFSGYIDSEEFSGLTDDLLDQLAITTAKLRLQLGMGVGVAARLAEGAKVRGDLSVVMGTSCELDIAAMFGGRVTLRTILEGIGEIIDNPTHYLPQCPILSALYGSGGGGGSSDGASGSAGGPASGQSAGGNTSGPGLEHEVPGGVSGSAATPSEQQREETSSGSSSSGGYVVSENFPPNQPDLDLVILSVSGPLRLDTPAGTEMTLNMVISTEHVPSPFQVPVHVRVEQITPTQIILKLTKAWWIERLQVGSARGSEYTLEIPQ